MCRCVSCPDRPPARNNIIIGLCNPFPMFRAVRIVSLAVAAAGIPLPKSVDVQIKVDSAAIKATNTPKDNTIIDAGVLYPTENFNELAGLITGVSLLVYWLESNNLTLFCMFLNNNSVLYLKLPVLITYEISQGSIY